MSKGMSREQRAENFMKRTSVQLLDQSCFGVVLQPVAQGTFQSTKKKAEVIIMMNTPQNPWWTTSRNAGLKVLPWPSQYPDLKWKLKRLKHHWKSVDRTQKSSVCMTAQESHRTGKTFVRKNGRKSFKQELKDSCLSTKSVYGLAKVGLLGINYPGWPNFYCGPFFPFLFIKSCYLPLA